jgi:thiamine-monophosphate kinase
MPLVKSSEIEIIKMISRKAKADSSVIFGIGDDAAVLRYTKDRYLLFTCDMLIEDVDFTSNARPEEIGHKALACGISDIAAMGGLPRHSLVSLGLPKKNAQKFIDRFYHGLCRLAKRFKVNIVGGDLSLSRKTVIDVSILGEVNKKNLCLRKGARLGDIIFVSGRLGGSLYGRHLRFIPRVKEARYLVKNYRVNAMMDISDGLSIDLYRLCASSGAGAVIYEDLIPVSKYARSFAEALHMGEDFELLFSLPAKEARRLIQRNTGIFKAIGEIRPKRFGIKLITKGFKEKILQPKGYQHF